VCKHTYIHMHIHIGRQIGSLVGVWGGRGWRGWWHMHMRRRIHAYGEADGTWPRPTDAVCDLYIYISMCVCVCVSMYINPIYIHTQKPYTHTHTHIHTHTHTHTHINPGGMGSRGSAAAAGDTILVPSKWSIHTASAWTIRHTLGTR